MVIYATFLWIQNLMQIMPQSLLWCIKYHVVIDCIITATEYIRFSIDNSEFSFECKIMSSMWFSWPWICSISTHWGRVTHICVSNPTIIGSDNGLSPSRCQAIIWTNAGILLIRPLGTNFSEILIEIHIFSFKKMHFKWSSGKWQPFCPGLNVLNVAQLITADSIKSMS